MKNVILPKFNPFKFNKFVTVAIFFLATPLVIAVSLITLITMNVGFKEDIKKPADTKVLSSITSGVKIFASLPSSYPEIAGEVLAADARGEIIKDYLINYNSPLEPYAYLIVNTADKYGLDFRLITAIAQQESNLCKNYPEGTFNCWGWGIHSLGTLGFSSFEEGIEEVSKGLKENYIKEGYVTPEIIMTKYTPLSNGSWAKGVTQFLSDME
jgi:hypothetical protein